MILPSRRRNSKLKGTACCPEAVRRNIFSPKRPLLGTGAGCAALTFDRDRLIKPVSHKGPTFSYALIDLNFFFRFAAPRFISTGARTIEPRPGTCAPYLPVSANGLSPLSIEFQ